MLLTPNHFEQCINVSSNTYTAGEDGQITNYKLPERSTGVERFRKRFVNVYVYLG